MLYLINMDHLLAEQKSCTFGITAVLPMASWKSAALHGTPVAQALSCTSWSSMKALTVGAPSAVSGLEENSKRIVEEGPSGSNSFLSTTSYYSVTRDWAIKERRSSFVQYM